MKDNKRQINIYLTEKFLGKCWHKADLKRGGYYCENCGIEFEENGKYNLDLFTPDGFFLLWEKAQEQEWWEEFIRVTSMGKIHRFISSDDAYYLVRVEYVNPLTFPTLLAEYLGWKEEDNHE